MDVFCVCVCGCHHLVPRSESINLHFPLEKKNPVIPSAWLLAELLLNMDGAILVASYSFSTIISLPPRALPNLIPFSIDDGPVFCLQKLHLIFVFGCSVMYINFGSYLFIFFFLWEKNSN